MSVMGGCVWISVFTSLVGISVGIASAAIALNVSAITAPIKKYESIINKNKIKHNTIA